MVISKAKATTKKLLPPMILKLVKSLRSTDSKWGLEQGPEYYDEIFVLKETSRKHYTQTNHYAVWSALVDRVMRTKVESVLDIGCGAGMLALFFRDQGLTRYLGFDFSTKKIEWARTLCPEFSFVVADAFKTDLFHSHDYDVVVCCEFLEHIEQDLNVVEKIPRGKRFYGTVPNFPGYSHVRHFTSIQEVHDRYESYFESFSVHEFPGVFKGKFYLMEGIKV